MLMTVNKLSIAFRTGKGRSWPVRGVSLAIPERTRVALVGESGSGKSLTALALGGLVDRAEITGEITGSPRLGYIFQNPMQSLNPVMKIGAQIIEAICDKRTGNLRARTEELLQAVGLVAGTINKYPCQLSGGQQQRAMIAMALAREPELLIADEPTTALDVTTQHEVLELIDRLSAERGMSVLLITHNLACALEHADYVYVMYAGEIMESGKAEAVILNPRHPYTQGLLAAVPRLDAPKDAPLADLPGVVRSPYDETPGCAFAPRCRQRMATCQSKNFTNCPLLSPIV